MRGCVLEETSKISPPALVDLTSAHPRGVLLGHAYGGRVGKVRYVAEAE